MDSESNKSSLDQHGYSLEKDQRGAMENETNPEEAQVNDSTTTTVQREEKFSFLSLCGIAVTTGESWIVLGNSLTFAIYSGGSPAVLFGFIADSICYWIVALSIAELASSMPSTATVYHWAHITGGRYGHITSWYAGWWSFAAWQLGVASLVSFMSLQTVGMYAVLHPGYESQNWHIFCAYIVCNWTVCALVLFGDWLIPYIESCGIVLTLGGWLISIIVCAAMPHTSESGYASNTEVSTDWQNQTGWSSNGFVFCLAMLNAAFAVCAPDIPCHLAEEIPNPKRNVPLAIFAQYVASFATGFLFLITLLYASSNLQNATSTHSVFPLSTLYLQATSRSATVGLLVLALLPTIIGATGGFAIAGRQGWALARENATPFSAFFAELHPRSQAPFRSIAFVGCTSTVLGCIYLGSVHAFNAIAGSFVIFTSLSYLAAILPHLLSGRKFVKPGVFWMPHPIGLVVNALSCLYLLAFSVIFCFPSSLPVDAANMNYTSVIVSGWTLFATAWFFLNKEGPKAEVEPREEEESVAVQRPESVESDKSGDQSVSNHEKE